MQGGLGPAFFVIAMSDWTPEQLDQQYPLLAPGAEPPGHADPITKVWRGLIHWRTEHGKAVALWQSGRPMSFLSARYPDGTRGSVAFMLDHGYRRIGPGLPRYVYGRVDITDDEIAFVDGDQPTYVPPPLTEIADLEAELARDPAFLEALQDDRFALAVYAIFGNRNFYKGSLDVSHAMGERGAARFVANLRGLGESYHDYFMSEFEGVWPDDREARERQVRQIEEMAVALTFCQSSDESSGEGRDVTHRQFQDLADKARRELDEGVNNDVFYALHAHLSRLGWRTETEEDRQQIRTRRFKIAHAALRDVEALERRPAGDPGAWVGSISARSRGGPGSRGSRTWSISASPIEQEVASAKLPARIDDLALSGRISESEYCSLVERTVMVWR